MKGRNGENGMGKILVEEERKKLDVNSKSLSTVF